MTVTPAILTEDDLRTVTGILGEVASMDGSPDEKRVHLMGGLSQLIETDSWVWGVSPFIRPGEQPVYLHHLCGGFDDARMSRLFRAIEHPDSGVMTEPLARAMIETGAHVTRLRQQIITNERFLGSPANPLWAAAGVGPLILSLRPIPGLGTAVTGFYRPVSAPLFTPREARIAHIVLTEISWLHEAGMPHLAARPIPRLPPRCRLILNQLVKGLTRKQIAADLDLSIHTVNGYLKQIYSHFGVHSQIQLIARFRDGDGNDHGPDSVAD